MNPFLSINIHLVCKIIRLLISKTFLEKLCLNFDSKPKKLQVGYTIYQGLQTQKQTILQYIYRQHKF